MKPILAKISSFLLALLVLFSTFSFTVEKHYCGDFLVDVSFTGNAHSCDVDLDKIATTGEVDCCTDEIQHIEGQDNLRHTQVDDLELSQQQFLTSFYISYKDLFVAETTKYTSYKDFSPPNFLLNYQVLYQTFLI